MKKIVCMFVLILTAVCVADIRPEWTENWGERAAWSRAKIRHNTSGFFETFDLPEANKLRVQSWPLEKLDDPGVFVDPGTDFSGRPLLVSFISPKQSSCWKRSSSIETYRRLHEAFKDTDAVLIAVWQDRARDAATRRANAEKYFAQNPVPGIVLIDDGKNGFKKFSANCINTSYEATTTVIKNRDDEIVFRGYYKEYPFDAFKLMLTRAMDAEYDALARQEFPSKSRFLPIDSSVKNALVYRDGFESYDDTYDLRTATRWGFRYETQHRIDNLAELAIDPENSDSKCAKMTAGQKWYHYTKMEHDLPVPLKNGSLKFRLYPIEANNGRSSDSLNKGYELNAAQTTALIITLRRPESIVPAGYLVIKNDSFQIIHDTPFIGDRATTGSVKIKKGKWQTIEIKAKEGRNAEVFVDDALVGSLLSPSIMGLTFRVSPGSEFLIDDVSASYTGDASILTTNHAAYVADSTNIYVGESPCPYTAEEKESFVFDNEGIPHHEFDQLKRAPKFEAPLQPNGSYAIEKAYKPGEYVNITEDHKGEVVFLHQTQDMEPMRVLKKTIGGSHQTTEARKWFYDDFHDQAQIYDRIRGRGMTFRSGYEEYREYYHELGEAKRAARRLLGKACFWEVSENLDEDHYLMESVTDHYIHEWVRIGNFKLWGGGHGSMPDSMSGCVINRDGKILNYTFGEFDYHEGAWIAMRAALDDDFRESAANDFAEGSPIVKSRLFPIAEETASGMVYKENFDSYADDTALRTTPAWGWDYNYIKTEQNQGLNTYIAGRNELAAGEGKDGSTAMLVDISYAFDRVWEDSNYQPNYDLITGPRKSVSPKLLKQRKERKWKMYKGFTPMKHTFPEELKNGTLKFSLRQGPKTKEFEWGRREGLNDNMWFLFEMYDKDGGIIDTICTTGKPTQTASLYLENANAGSVSIAVDDWKEGEWNDRYPLDKTWHEVKIVAKPGSNVEVFVDDQSIGQLPTQSLFGIGLLGRAGDSMVVDDFELFYKN